VSEGAEECWRYLDAVARHALVARRIPSVSCACSNQLLNNVSGSADISALTSSGPSPDVTDVIGSCDLGCWLFSEISIIQKHCTVLHLAGHITQWCHPSVHLSISLLLPFGPSCSEWAVLQIQIQIQNKNL